MKKTLLKKITMLVAILFLTIGYSQNSITTDANEITIDGLLLKDGVPTTATVVATYVSTSTSCWIAVREASAASDNGTASGSTTLKDVNADLIVDNGDGTLTRTFNNISSIGALSLPITAVGTYVLQLRATGGVKEPLNGLPVAIVGTYYSPNYIKIESFTSTYNPVQRGEDFTVSFNYTTNVDIPDFKVALWMKSVDGVYDHVYLTESATETILLVNTGGEDINVSKTVTLTFPLAETFISNKTGTDYTFNINETPLPAGFSYEFRFVNTAVNWAGTTKMSFNAGPLSFPTINAASTAGIEDYQQLEGVNIYPNPSSDVLNVVCPEGSKVALYNIMGGKVKSVEKASKNFTLSVSDLASGLYIMKVENEGKFYSKKLQVK